VTVVFNRPHNTRILQWITRGKNPVERPSLPACTIANPRDSMHSTIWCDS